ncbi:phospholipid carrier-dependent glycosyltransferase [Limnothrix sp. FACHB-708]|uniref:phospholipid carrier-dependent glycosyltransferase n=1 Tax=unclassified Limnothrix TaxID=2632864 RepID=UPI001687D60B|nr:MULTISPECIES: phospholipid carrier-dependent glycosyltransferase [unclassified Limnothrix]MBD2552079.1 phospholipid carrier-dependent glycosyltransferase [Limnothrix sp. FACHB-708]MBD2589759.1 phospholipid carrier-dependent glycosyltransferase [Limnothrix sp. FACHB-406]
MGFVMADVRSPLDHSPHQEAQADRGDFPRSSRLRWDWESHWWWILGAIVLAGAIVRFWHLGHLNTLVFDEVYFAQFARDYLVGKPVEDGHPPLSKYLIAIGIAISEHFQWGRDNTNQATGSLLATVSYRWLNALVGSLMPLVVAWLAWLISGRRLLALVAAGAIALDGLFLVESRYGLNNVYLVIFGLLGHCGWLMAARAMAGRSRYHWQVWAWLVVAGLGFGCTASVKWNGLAFLVGAWGSWALWRVWHWLDRPGFTTRQSTESIENAEPPESIENSPSSRMGRSAANPLTLLQRFSPIQMGLMLGLLPLVIYWLLWIPHAQMNPGKSIWEFNQDLLRYHHRVGGDDAHPYCSRWFTWPLLLRPIAYFYARTSGPNAPIDYQNPIPKDLPAGTPTVYDVHALGNPLLWWLTAGALVVALWWLGRYRWRSIAQPAALANPLVSTDYLESPVVRLGSHRWQLRLMWERSGAIGAAARSPEVLMLTYCLVNYGANWLPWAKVSRCTFLYHYMGAFVFSSLVLAWLLDRLWQSRSDRPLSIAAMILIGLSFLFWLPVYLGWPLTPFDWQLRIWGIEGVRWLPYWI